jgi:PEP-CTERM motif
MKKTTLAVMACLGTLPLSAAVTYFDLANLEVPNDIDGIYINIITGVTAYTYPLDFNDAPWINLYLGGTGISNSDLLRPWASQAPGVYDGSVAGNYFLNVALGTTIDSSGVFVSGESNSEFHLGAAGDQFQSGTQGYLAFAYEGFVGGDTSYGWFSLMPNDSGPGYSIDLAYSDTPGEALTVGLVPEPSSYATLVGVAALGLVALRRRRRAA